VITICNNVERLRIGTAEIFQTKLSTYQSVRKWCWLCYD